MARANKIGNDFMIYMLMLAAKIPYQTCLIPPDNIFREGGAIGLFITLVAKVL